MNKSRNLWCWLSETYTNSDTHNYTHRLLKEDFNNRSLILDELKSIVQNGHEDAKRHLHKVAGVSLDPLGTDSLDPTTGYPERLDTKTLQGYFGEIFAGIVAESFPHFGEDGWEVPAFPFRFHKVAFAALEKWRQTGDLPREIPGRTGDDMLAFRRDKIGKIIRSLVCEAKCSTDHRADLISKAHQQASGALPKPIDLFQLIEILQDYDDSDSKEWVNALRNLYYRDVSTDYERIDLVSYICGRTPKRGASWIPSDRPHEQYTGRRKLEAVEIHLQEIIDLIQRIYNVPSNDS